MKTAKNDRTRTNNEWQAASNQFFESNRIESNESDGSLVSQPQPILRD
jgi:hypothetical protein